MDCIADNTVLSNFAAIHQAELLKDIFDKDGLNTPKHVFDELKIGEQRQTIPVCDWSWLQVLMLETRPEYTTFTQLARRFGNGESACLSLCIHRQKKILTDDLDARQFAQQCGIPVSGTIGVLVLGLQRAIISLDTGNRALADMISHGYYSPFRQLDSLV